jgi:hypothetical protein
MNKTLKALGAAALLTVLGAGAAYAGQAMKDCCCCDQKAEKKADCCDHMKKDAPAPAPADKDAKDEPGRK